MGETSRCVEPQLDNDERPAGGYRKFVVAGLAVLLVAACGVFFLVRREPRYEGRSLTEWLVEFGPPGPGQEGIAQGQKAIRAMGASAVPQLITYLKPSSAPSPLLNRMDEWMANRLDVAIPLPHEKEWQVPALDALGILGPVAQPAITNVAALLGDNILGWRAAVCLAAIGPASIPALTNALASTNILTRVGALTALGQLGDSASATTPLIAARIHDPANPVGYQALNILGLTGAGAEPYVPEMERMFFNADRGPGAALALARLGRTASLLRGLTNSDERVRAWAAAALAPRPDAALMPFFSKKNLADYADLGNQPRITDLLLAHLGDPEPAARALAADQLGNAGLAAVHALPALSNALADPSELVRRSVTAALGKIDVVIYQGGIIRGPRKERKIALEFTGHTFAEGGATILDALASHHARASFFVTGDFLDNPAFRPLVERIAREGHYLGPHSDKHLQYMPWGVRKNALVPRDVFENDLALNKLKAKRFANVPVNYWLPAYEWYNQEIVDWSYQLDLTLVNYSPGTRSNADYMEDGDKNYVSSQAIYDSIIKREREDPDGLNGFLLLMHLGSGPGRTDKMSDRLGALLDYLTAKGYQFVRVDELLESRH